MGRKKIQISRIMDERNRQVNCIFIGIFHFLDKRYIIMPAEIVTVWAVR